MNNSHHIKNTNWVGKKFGRLEIIEELEDGYYKDGQKFRQVKCKCSCGNIITKNLYKILYGTKSCGCLANERRIESRIKHSATNTTEYSSWSKMKDRCYNKNSNKYYCYGARGIKICDRWRDKDKGFANFLSDVGYKPYKNYTIDRINVNGDYCPENCRWASPKIQANNTTINRKIQYEGEIKTLSEWSDIYNIKQDTLRARLDKYNMDFEEAIKFNRHKYHFKPKGLIRAEQDILDIFHSNNNYEDICNKYNITKYSLLHIKSKDSYKEITKDLGKPGRPKKFYEKDM